MSQFFGPCHAMFFHVLPRSPQVVFPSIDISTLRSINNANNSQRIPESRIPKLRRWNSGILEFRTSRTKCVRRADVQMYTDSMLLWLHMAICCAALSDFGNRDRITGPFFESVRKWMFFGQIPSGKWRINTIVALTAPPSIRPSLCPPFPFPGNVWGGGGG